jgi:uncharacterized protein involved in exopolysaccharide biosynthesis
MSDDRNEHHSENGAQPPAPQRPYAEDEVSLLDILLVIARHKQLILRTVLVFTVLGVTYALVASEEYTSTAKVVREAQEDMPSGLSGGLAALQGFGINIGGASSGLTPQAYADILSSREVRLAVVRDTFYFADEDRTTTFIDYVDRPPGLVGTILKYTIGLPGTILEALQGDQRTAVATQSGARVYPTEAEEKAIKAIGERISSSVDQETGLMSVSVTAGEARLAAGLTESFLQHLTDRVSAIRTEKARRNLGFMEERFTEVEQELRAAEETLATFVDQNSGIQSARLETERERLQRQVSFKSELYQQLQAQVTQARIELQRSEPVITVVEEPVPPIEPSAPRRLLVVIMSVFLGTITGVGVAFLDQHLNKDGDSESSAKIDEIKTKLFPRQLVRKARSSLGIEK